MANNARTLLSKSSSYYGDALNVINTPSKRYANINPNCEIK